MQLLNPSHFSMYSDGLLQSLYLPLHSNNPPSFLFSSIHQHLLELEKYPHASSWILLYVKKPRGTKINIFSIQFIIL